MAWAEAEEEARLGALVKRFEVIAKAQGWEFDSYRRTDVRLRDEALEHVVDALENHFQAELERLADRSAS